MPRRARIAKRPILPDGKYHNKTVGRFINRIMLRGKKSVAENIVYTAFDHVRERMPEDDPAEVFSQAVENVRPLLEVKSRRVGGANYQVPVEVRPERRQALAFRWLLDAAAARHEKTMCERLANELLEAYAKQGAAIRKREDVHRMAEANKAFAHYRW